MYDERQLKEECGVFGVYNHPDANQVTYFGLHSLQHRGQEGAGIVSYDTQTQQMHSHRGLGLLSQVFKNPTSFNQLVGPHAIGHVRYATAGTNHIRNVQPFLFTFHDMSLAFAHNGHIVNAQTLKTELEKRGAIFQSDSDSEILVHLIRHSLKENFYDQLKDALAQLKGGFTFVLLKDDVMYGAVDAQSFRPLVVGKMPNGGYVLASESCALDTVNAKFLRNVEAGEIIRIDESGLAIDKYTNDTSISISAMEYIYFARPDSDIAGINVHTARKNSGKILAREAPVPHADIVIGVPNSSLSAASGYAEESRIPYEMGLIKNQYVARTFIQPTQELREQGVRMKLSAVRGVVAGKVVVMVDDSIVRGTTSKRIVRLLKDAGAKEVHVRIASPAFRFPSFYGIDVSTTEELIAAHKTTEEIADYIEADSLVYLSEGGLIEAIGLKFNAPYTGLCLESFNGDYPVPLCDYEEAFKGSLTPLQKDYLRKREEQDERSV